MLVRDDDGYYRPAHKSLIEFFSAYKLAAAIGALKEEYVEAARKHANVDRNLQPVEQQWSVYFRATVGDAQVLPPLARFAKESTEELEKTWAQVALDDATSEFILLLCGQSELLRYVKSQTSSDVIEGTVAGRALNVAAFGGDLHGADLAGAIVSGCHLHNCNLKNVDLSRSSWLEGSFGLVSFDHSSLRGASFRGVSFIDVTLRDADLSESNFEVNPHYVNIIGGIWCTKDNKEILLVVLIGGRFIAITPKTLVVQALAQPDLQDQELTSGELTSWLLGLSDTLDLGGELGHVSLDRNGWSIDRDLIDGELAYGLTSKFTESDASGGDVDTLDIEVTVEATQQVLLKQKMHDTTALSSYSTVLRAMALSKTGKHLAVISGTFHDEETAWILSGNSALGVPLRDFQGDILEPFMSQTIDNRGAAFSSSGNILAICEDQNVVGFWRTSDGECMGRVIFQTAARGCIVDGATGLPPEFILANSDGKDGWIVEPPS
jgi:pentapeptide repeat protein